MPVFDQKAVVDGGFAKEAFRELSGIFEERVIVKCWTSKSGGNPKRGIKETDAFDSIRARANITEMSAREVGIGDIYRMGDLKAEFRIPIFGGTSLTNDKKTKGDRPDLVVYRGREYHVVGQPFRCHLANKTHWQCILRQVK